MRLMSRRTRVDADLVLTRSLCHELRPPMATLTGLVRALEKSPSEQRRAQIARLAVEHLAYAEAMLGQAAETARGLPDRTVAAVPLRDLLPAVAVTAPAGALTVTASRAALRWPVHPRHTQQILINLVDNAVRHAPGPVRLSVGVRSRRLRLAVEDGGGVTAGLRAALCRGTPPPDERGLGLWVVRQRLASLRGALRARGLRPAGLVLEVSLPRHR
jgi:two-component system, OmpR family, sensor kinase